MPFSPFLRLLLLVAFFLSLVASQDLGCDQQQGVCDPGIDQFKDAKIQIKHASKTIPKVKYSNAFVDVDVRSDNDVFKYRFVPCGCNVSPGNRLLILIGPTSVFVQEGPVLALFHFLAEENISFIKAVLNKDFIFNEDIRALINNNNTQTVGDSNGKIDYRKLTDIDPKLSIIGTFTVEDFRSNGPTVPFLVAAENQEQNPLARSEWMKLIGLVLGRPTKANKEFEEIEKRYNETKKNATKAIRRPAVFFNKPSPKGGSSGSDVDERYSWTQPVEDEYLIQLLKDANADYRYIDEDPVPGQVGDQFNISTIVRDFKSADYLINSSLFPGSSNRTLAEYLKEMFSPDSPGPKARGEVEKLRAVRCTAVWNRQKRVTSDGKADDFFESAIVRPDVVLADLIQALHPYLDFNGRETFYIYRYENTGIDPPFKCPFTVLSGTPRNGFEFIDKKFSDPELDRYQIADRLEDKVFPAIRKQIDERFEVFFHHEDVSKSETHVTVRIEAKSAEKEQLEKSDKVARGMIEALGSGVKELNEDGSARPAPEDEGSNEEGGGLSGGAIAGIVIGVIIVVAVIGGFLYIRRSRTRRVGYASQVGQGQGQAQTGGDYWGDDADATGRRDDGASPFV